MARVRQRDTAPERLVRRALWQRGLRYRLQARDLPGTPDLVFRRAKIAVFVHGCFWHRHPDCRRASTPKTNVAFWLSKFQANVVRDERNEMALHELGWHVLVIWECEVRNETSLSDFAERTRRLLKSR